jgi:hypothetical protein
MAIFRKIHTQFWSDPFVQTLSPEKKYFFLYLLTNEKTKQCGIYEISKRQISYDTGYTIDTVSILLEYFISEKKIMFSDVTNEIAIKNWNKYNGNPSPKVQKLVNEEIGKIKDNKLILYLYPTHTVPIHIPQEEEEREQEKEEEVGSEKVKEIANLVWQDQIWKEQICMGLGMKVDELQKWLAMFNSSVASDRVANFDKSSYKKMSRGWIQRQKQKGIVVETGLSKTSTAPTLTRL